MLEVLRKGHLPRPHVSQSSVRPFTAAETEKLVQEGEFHRQTKIPFTVSVENPPDIRGPRLPIVAQRDLVGDAHRARFSRGQ